MTTKQATKPIKLTVAQRKLLASLKSDKFEFVEKRKIEMAMKLVFLNLMSTSMAVARQDFQKGVTQLTATFRRTELGTEWLNNNPATA